METIAKYELREVLGRGGMGVVYRAYDPLMDREVALKIIQERALDIPELKARFVQEARMAGRLSHENIAVVHDLGEAGGKTFIVMEYLEGRNLRSIIDSREPLQWQEKLDFAAQICRGLHFAHVNGIIHRDIKPENIQVLPSQRIKIMDFGIAKPRVEGNVPVGSASQMTLTSAGMRIGTPSYMSPEQVKGLQVDRRSDIFSLGVLLYELFTFEKPFLGDDTTVLYKIVHEEPEPLKIEDNKMGEVLQRVVRKCLAKEPAARYDDCLQVLRDLQDARPRKTMGKDDQMAPGPASLQPATLKALPGSFIGQTVSHFRILEKIGDGGMGTVYKAEDLTLKRVVALKFLLSEGTLHPRAKERFLMEAQAASALDHQNICTIYEIGETGGGLFFICMSYCAGEDLGKILQKRSMDVREVLSICMKVAAGLSKAHGHGIVHRDIKPANIIISPAGEAKIVDFGLAKLSGGTQFTRMASIMGTLPYMSPEQIKGNEVDYRTDVWSLGIVLYQALTGKLPFEGAYEAALFYAIVNESPLPPSQIRPSLPPVLDTVIARALAKKADERYPTMDDFLKDMERVLQDEIDTEHGEPGSSPEVVTLLENGKAYLERRKFTEALSRFEAVLTLAPGHSEAETLRLRALQEIALGKELDILVRQAESLLERGKNREAREILLGVAVRDPQHKHAVELLDRAQMRLDEDERLAKQLLDAQFYEQRGKFNEARECYQKVLELRPDHREASRGLKRTERQKAQETERVLRKTPLPTTARSTKRFVLPASFLLVAILGAIAWFYLRPGTQTTHTESSNSPASTSDNLQAERTGQNGMGIDAGRVKPAGPATVPGTSEAELKDLVKKARDGMLREKRRAEKRGTIAGSSESSHGALEQEKQADRAARPGTKEGLEKALALYETARDSYRNAADVPNVPRRNPSETSEVHVGTTDKKQESVGDANKSVVQGGILPHPGTTDAPPTSQVNPPPTPEAKEAQSPSRDIARNDINPEATARNEISKLLQEYRESIERGDVKSLSRLLNLSDLAESNWSLFFSSSEDRKVAIEGVNMDIDHDNARVTFKTKMSFFNNQTNAPQNSDNSRQWILAFENGIWRVVTQK